MKVQAEKSMKTNVQRPATEQRAKASKPVNTLKRTERQFALRQQLVYRDPQQWDKDITSGAGEV